METDIGASTFLYFAYGSNMLIARLTDRCPSAKRIGVARAENRDLVFAKRSIDRSGKAMLVPTQGRHCLGVVFEIDMAERAALEEFEGPGYLRDGALAVVTPDGLICETTTYLAQEVVSGLKPYDWYLALILAGCQEHALDAEYLQMLRGVEAAADPNPDRRTYLAAVRALEKSGVAPR